MGTGYISPETERARREADGLSPSDKDKECAEIYLHSVISRRGGNKHNFTFEIFRTNHSNISLYIQLRGEWWKLHLYF